MTKNAGSEGRIHRIAIVDDHRLFRAGLHGLLSQSAHWEVAGEAADERELRRILDASDVDLVLMDLQLAVSHGAEITRQILADYPQMKVIALTSDSSASVVHAAIVAGVHGYVLKENALDELERAIAAVLAGRTYFCAQVSGTVMNNLRHGCVAAPAPDHQLTEREIEVIRLVAEGKRTKEIADALSITAKSAETYRLRLMRKLKLDSAAALTRYAIREGLIKA